MKKPRIEDFDPHHQPPQLQSPIDDYPKIEKPKVQVPPSAPIKEESETEATGVKDDARAGVRAYGRTPVRRAITRYAFEFFLDQIDALRQFSLQEKGRGEKGSMSEMVREALDAYIAERQKKVTS